MNGIGVDIMEIGRVRRAPRMRRVAEFVLSRREMGEMDSSRDAAQFLASRFAVKEAVIKAFPDSISFQDFEVRKDGAKPAVYFFDPRHRGHAVSISISHSAAHAVGVAFVA